MAERRASGEVCAICYTPHALVPESRAVSYLPSAIRSCDKQRLISARAFQACQRWYLPAIRARTMLCSQGKVECGFRCNMSPQVAQEVGERWVWILDIIFGSVIGFGFQKLEEGLRASARASTTAFLKHLLMAMGFLGFVIYDIGVYHILIKNFPYDFSRPSAARYVLDLVMAFLLMIILVRGLSSDAGENLFEILIALSLWHLAAICWHFAATVQMHNEIPKVSTFLPHLVFIGLYWSFFGVWYLGMIHRLPEKRVDAKAFLVILGGLLLCISIWRSHQMIRTFVNTAERDIASQSFGNPASRPTVPESSLNPPRPFNEGSECRLHDTFCISFYPLRIGMDTAPVMPAFPPTY